MTDSNTRCEAKRNPQIAIGQRAAGFSGGSVRGASWLVVSSAVNMAVNFVATAVVARYFGPSQFGQFSYALSVVVLFTAISTLGLEAITVKSLVDGKRTETEVLGTTLVLRIAGGLSLTVISVLVVSVLEPTDNGLRVLTVLLSLMMTLRALDVIEYWFQSRNALGIPSLIRVVANLISAIFKIAVAFMHGPLTNLACAYVIDATLVGIGLVFAYIAVRKNPRRWSCRLEYARFAVRQGWPIMVSGLMGTVYMRIDQVMLGSMLKDGRVLGEYAAAANLATMWYFIPLALITATNPGIMRAHAAKQKTYGEAMTRRYSIVGWLSISISVITVLTAGLMVDIVYGPAYHDAAMLLRLSVFAGVFAMLGSARSIWLVCERLQRYAPIYAIAGASMNVLLNLIMIPSVGAVGASIATVAAQCISVVLVPMLFKPTRASVRMMIEGLNPKYAAREFRSTVCGLRLLPGRSRTSQRRWGKRERDRI